jgi:hypothetical protein
MEIDQLTRAMQAGEQVSNGTVPDLDSLRTGGRRLRRNRRLLAGAVAALVAGVVAAGVLATSARLDRAEEPVGPDHGPALSTYEKRVLRELPGSYAVGGTIIVPGPIDPDHVQNLAYEVSGFTGRLAPLGWHGLSSFPVYSTVRYPDFMLRPAPEDTQLYVDVGPLRIGCLQRSAPHCDLVLVVGERHSGWLSFETLGTDEFLTPGSEMELFPGGTFDGRVHRPTVIGGFRGTRATEVELTLKDGTRVPATVDSGRVSPGDTIFWARTESPPVRATAYDAAGALVEDHKVTPCDDPVDCLSR